MATYVNNLRLKEITTGDEDGTWGTSTNTNLELITDGFSYGTKEMAADANETFTMPDATADDTRSFYLKITSAVSLTATREVTLGPNTVSKVWMIENATSGSQIITIKQGSGATVNVPNGSKVLIVTDGAGAGAAVLNANPTEVGGTVTSVGGTGTVNGLTLTGTVTSSGNLTLGGSLADVNLTTQVTGTLPVANGGTGSTTASGALTNFGLTATATELNYTDGVTSNIQTQLDAKGPGTVTSVSGTGTVDGLTLSGTVTSSGNLTLGGSVSINNANWSGTDLSLANGGTGASLVDPNADRIFFWDDSAGSTAFLTVGSGLQISGTTLSSTAAGGTVTSVDVSGGTTGLTTSGGPITGSGTITLAGTLAVANGGTGATTSTGSGSVVLATAPTLNGTVTLNQTNIYTNTSAEINNTIGDKGTFLNFTQSRSGGASNANFVLGHGGNSSGDVEFKNTTSSHIKFYVADVERVRLYAGGALIASSGVTLGTAVDTYNAANTLDDYEEGTFTPVVADDSAGGNTASVSTINGWYTKVGRQVTVYVALLNINTTGMTAGNFLYIRNLPFAALNTTSGNSMGSVEVDNIDFTGYVTASIGLNQSYLLLKDSIDSSGDAVLTVASVLSSLSDIKVTITYNV